MTKYGTDETFEMNFGGYSKTQRVRVRNVLPDGYLVGIPLNKETGVEFLRFVSFADAPEKPTPKAVPGRLYGQKGYEGPMWAGLEDGKVIGLFSRSAFAYNPAEHLDLKRA